MCNREHCGIGKLDMRRLYWKGVEAAQETVVAKLPYEGSAFEDSRCVI
jgi:hypothetical protein